MKRYAFHSLALALVLALAWVGCNTEPQSTAPSAPAVDVAAKPVVAGDVEAVAAVQNRHTDRLLDIPGVVGTATGLGLDGNPAIVVLAEQPGIRGIPDALEGVPVIVKATGKIVALGKPGGSADPTARFPRPVPIGISTGHPDITAGTIGTRVKDLVGNVYALSNNHVYADQNRATLGDNVLQPGPYDGGINPADAIGTLANFVAIKFDGTPNYIDAAIALSSTANLGKATPSGGYGSPKWTTALARINQKVMKYGRTTKQTTGSVYALNATVNVGYDQGAVARFDNQIIIIPGNFSAGGDSGSLIVLNEKGDNSRKPVGLLFAGSNTVTIANPIDAVLSAFSVTIDGE